MSHSGVGAGIVVANGARAVIVIPAYAVAAEVTENALSWLPLPLRYWLVHLEDLLVLPEGGRLDLPIHGR